MLPLPSPNENAAERTRLGGMDFVLRTATQSHGKDRANVYIFETRAFYKPSS